MDLYVKSVNIPFNYSQASYFTKHGLLGKGVFPPYISFKVFMCLQSAGCTCFSVFGFREKRIIRKQDSHEGKVFYMLYQYLRIIL